MILSNYKRLSALTYECPVCNGEKKVKDAKTGQIRDCVACFTQPVRGKIRIDPGLQ
jgi:hypothetical protein